ncbi:MAG: hypothetical protein AAEJ52_19345 [Myxococcota bacterium]
MGSNGDNRTHVPLTGADCFLRAFDAEIQRTSAANHVSQLVLRLGPGFDVELFRKLIEQVTHAQPIVRAPIGRRFGVAGPVFRVSDAARAPAPKLNVIDVEAAAPDDAALPGALAAPINLRMNASRGELLRFDAIRYAGGAAGTDLAASWIHMLLDGSGSETFMGWLDACYRGECSPTQLPCPDEFDPLEPSELTLRQRGDAARTWQKSLSEFASAPPRSLSGPLCRIPQSLRYELLTLSPEQTRVAVARATELAGFMTPMPFYLAATIRAHAAVFRARGVDPGSFVVPLPVDLRPRGAARAMFRTHVSLIWFQVQVDQTRDLDELIGHLKQQRLAAIKAGQVENAVHAMEFARFAPKRVYTHMARRDFKGELCSFFFAFTGDFMKDVDSFLGAEIWNGFHVAPVPPSPGSCIAMSLRGDRLNATHVYQASSVSDKEREILREQLLRDLLG